jgi:PST family polysaccharide transporter
MWSAAEKWGAQVASTAVFLLLARLLDAEAFGLIALAHVFLSFVYTLLDQGFAQAIVQRENLDPEHLDTAFWTSVAMGGIFVLATLLGARFMANFYREPTLAPIIQTMSFSFLFAGLSSVHSAILQRNMQFKVFAVRSLVATVACGIAGIGAALVGLGVWSLVVKELVFGSTASLLLWTQCDWRPGWRFSTPHFQDMFSFGINIIGFNLLNFLNRHSDDMLIGYFLGSVALGYYSVAYRLLLIMIQLFSRITTQVSLPAFSRFQTQPDKIRSMYYKVTQIISLVSLPAFMALAVMAPELIRFFFGEQWMPSVPTMRILALSGTLQSIYAFNGTVLLAMNKPFLRLINQLTNTLANLVIFALVVHWGIVAVALGYVIRGYLLSPLQLFFVNKTLIIDFRKYLLQYAPALLGTVAMAITVFTIRFALKGFLYDALCIFVSGMAGTLTYVITVSWVAPELPRKIKTDILALAKV